MYVKKKNNNLDKLRETSSQIVHKKKGGKHFSLFDKPTNFSHIY